MTALASAVPTVSPTSDTSLDALVLYEGEMRRTRFACGCTLEEHPSLREANVCPRHQSWPIAADLIRYWTAAASVIFLTLVCA